LQFQRRSDSLAQFMSWVTVIWSMTSGICLTLGAVYFVIWTRQRDQWASLVFSISAAAAAAYAVLDLALLRAQTPAEYGELSRWTLLLGMLEGVSVAWFIRLYLRAGRLWLLWLICGLRALMLVLNFVPGPNFYFREITGLQQIPLLGELISRPHGLLHPWAILLQLSLLLIIIFVIDATHTASQRSGQRRAWVLGGLTLVGFALAIVSYTLYERGFLPSPFSGQLMLLVILVMGYELSHDVLRAAQLAGELRESEQRMTLAAEAAGFGIWMWSVASNQVWASKRWFSLFGFTPGADISFEKVIQRIHPEDREFVERGVRLAIEDGVDYVGEYRVVLPDCTERWISARGRMFMDGNRKPVRMLGASLDITERKKAEQELTQQRNELSHLSRVTTMSELSSSLAHELNQPLAIILTNAQAAQRLLAQEPPDVAETRDILADIVSEDERAGEVIRRLRALLKPGQTQRLPLSVNEIIEDVLSITRSDLIGRGVTVHTALTETTPQVMGDRIQLQQVLLNLILNASDAMAANPPAGRRLTIATAQHEGLVRISVLDQGCGLPSEPEHIFQPFYTTKKDGLGLGLSICRSIVTAHQGRLWAEANASVDSSPVSAPAGRGATLHLELPTATNEE
jgi:two-component system, LuxR family, sensor kinase FixL